MFEKYLKGYKFKGNLQIDVETVLELNKKYRISNHIKKVSITAIKIAEKYGVSEEKIQKAALLHDISGIVPNEEKIELCKSVGIDILEEELECPIVVHQKLSKYMAVEIFNVKDKEILSAIECHTTLKANASVFDKIIFLSDKISWDQDGKPPYIDRVIDGLEEGLDKGVKAFLHFQWENKEELQVMHPWLRESISYYIGK